MDRDRHFDASGKMREHVYGWYPPARDMYQTQRGGGSAGAYRKECLYNPARYLSSRASMTPSSPLRRTGSAPPGRSNSGSPAVDLHITGSTCNTCASPSTREAWATHTRPRPPTPHKTRPGKRWTTKIPSTADVAPPQAQFAPTPPESRSTSRVQSATIRRPRVSPKPRPVRSAGPTRPQNQNEENTACLDKIPESESKEEYELYKKYVAGQLDTDKKEEDDAEEKKDEESGEAAASEQTEAVPVPGDEADATLVDDTSVQEEYHPPQAKLDYDEQLKKHGWRMEIPGDPLGLKTPCIAPRLPYSFRCKTPETRPAPPNVHMQNYDTYFLNTIPQRPLSFVIHKDWVSEVLLAKRMELQNREGGVNYRWKNFSFVY